MDAQFDEKSANGSGSTPCKPNSSTNSSTPVCHSAAIADVASVETKRTEPQIHDLCLDLVELKTFADMTAADIKEADEFATEMFRSPLRMRDTQLLFFTRSSTYLTDRVDVPDKSRDDETVTPLAHEAVVPLSRGKLVSMGCLDIDDGSVGFLRGVCTQSNCQNRGHATAIVNRVLQYASTASTLDNPTDQNLGLLAYLILMKYPTKKFFRLYQT
jgi:hypothetical protein